jgi:hypothetical protein
MICDDLGHVTQYLANYTSLGLVLVEGLTRWPDNATLLALAPR